jgi:hypothetical protein
MASGNFLNFLNMINQGEAGKSNSFAEGLANFLTPDDKMEYRGGQLVNADGTSAMDRIGDKASYGTIGQANSTANDIMKAKLQSKMTSGPQGLLSKASNQKGEQAGMMPPMGEMNHMMPNGTVMSNSEMTQYYEGMDGPGPSLQTQYYEGMDGPNPLPREFEGYPNQIGITAPPPPEFEGYPNQIGITAPIGSGRGDGAIEQQSRAAEDQFYNFLNTFSPSTIEFAKSDPNTMERIKKLFFQTYPGLVKGMGGYN